MKRAVLLFSLVLTLATIALPQWTFDRYKVPKPLPNPYTIQATREQLVNAITQVMEKESFPIDTQESKPADGVIISKPVVFSKGINTKNDLAYFSDVPASEVRNWTKGRVTYTINIQPVDPTHSTLAIYSKIEGYAQSVTANNWVECSSKGLMEDKLMRDVLEKLNLKGDDQK